MRRKEKESLPQVRRVAAYAVIIRDRKILLSRLADALSPKPTWTLPGGGVEHGEDPHAAVVREVKEETGLDVTVSETAWLLSLHRPNSWRRGRVVDSHAMRIIYDGWVAVDAPEPHTIEVGGSTAEAAWHSLDAVLAGDIPTLSLVREALEKHQVPRVQRVAAYGFLTRPSLTRVGATEILLTKIAAHAVSGGKWHLPGGGLDFGESPVAGLTREFYEESGLGIEVGAPMDVRDIHFQGVAPSGRFEDFHGIHMVFEVTQISGGEPHVVELDGTTSDVRWVAVDELDQLDGLGTTAVVDAALKVAGLA